MNAVYQELGPCVCGDTACAQVGTKLSKALDAQTPQHLVGCRCSRHRGKRNRRKGQASQAKGHRALGGQGFTPGNEESVGGYPIVVQVEHKHGYKGSTTMLYKFIATEFFRRALSQAQRARRVGDGSMPAVMFDGRWLLVDCKRNQDGSA
jgi:hypothetical protein